MKTTDYFRNKVLQKRPYLRMEWIQAVMNAPARREAEPGGRIRYRGYIEALGRYLRVVMLDDGETVHNAFPDRRFK